MKMKLIALFAIVGVSSLFAMSTSTKLTEADYNLLRQAAAGNNPRAAIRHQLEDFKKEYKIGELELQDLENQYHQIAKRYEEGRRLADKGKYLPQHSGDLFLNPEDTVYY